MSQLQGATLACTTLHSMPVSRYANSVGGLLTLGQYRICTQSGTETRRTCGTNLLSVPACTTGELGIMACCPVASILCWRHHDATSCVMVLPVAVGKSELLQQQLCMVAAVVTLMQGAVQDPAAVSAQQCTWPGSTAVV